MMFLCFECCISHNCQQQRQLETHHVWRLAGCCQMNGFINAFVDDNSNNKKKSKFVHVSNWCRTHLGTPAESKCSVAMLTTFVSTTFSCELFTKNEKKIQNCNRINVCKWNEKIHCHKTPKAEQNQEAEKDKDCMLFMLLDDIGKHQQQTNRRMLVSRWRQRRICFCEHQSSLFVWFALKTSSTGLKPLSLCCDSWKRATGGSWDFQHCRVKSLNSLFLQHTCCASVHRQPETDNCITAGTFFFAKLWQSASCACFVKLVAFCFHIDKLCATHHCRFKDWHPSSETNRNTQWCTCNGQTAVGHTHDWMSTRLTNQIAQICVHGDIWQKSIISTEIVSKTHNKEDQQRKQLDTCLTPRDKCNKANQLQNTKETAFHNLTFGRTHLIVALSFFVPAASRSLAVRITRFLAFVTVGPDLSSCQGQVQFRQPRQCHRVIKRTTDSQQFVKHLDFALAMIGRSVIGLCKTKTERLSKISRREQVASDSFKISTSASESTLQTEVPNVELNMSLRQTSGTKITPSSCTDANATPSLAQKMAQTQPCQPSLDTDSLVQCWHTPRQCGSHKWHLFDWERRENHHAKPMTVNKRRLMHMAPFANIKWLRAAWKLPRQAWNSHATAHTNSTCQVRERRAFSKVWNGTTRQRTCPTLHRKCGPTAFPPTCRDLTATSHSLSFDANVRIPQLRTPTQHAWTDRVLARWIAGQVCATCGKSRRTVCTLWQCGDQSHGPLCKIQTILLSCQRPEVKQQILCPAFLLESQNGTTLHGCAINATSSFPTTSA